MDMTVSVTGGDGKIRAQKTGSNETVFVYDGEYEPGDAICIQADVPLSHGVFLVVRLDHTMAPCFCFLAQGTAVFTIPFNEKRISYAPFCFSGNRHYIHVRRAENEEIALRKNLALNPYDTHENVHLFPHATANVETRGESVFAARNAIDGYLADSSHGAWPYTSWGINRNPEATLEIDFGRTVIADELVLYLRADFPHDAWWSQATAVLSDGTHLILQLEKRGGAQRFKIDNKAISSLVLKNLIKADDPSPFPALTQIQVFGMDK